MEHTPTYDKFNSVASPRVLEWKYACRTRSSNLCNELKKASFYKPNTKLQQALQEAELKFPDYRSVDSAGYKKEMEDFFSKFKPKSTEPAVDLTKTSLKPEDLVPRFNTSTPKPLAEYLQAAAKQHGKDPSKVHMGMNIVKFFVEDSARKRSFSLKGDATWIVESKAPPRDRQCCHPGCDEHRLGTKASHRLLCEKHCTDLKLVVNSLTDEANTTEYKSLSIDQLHERVYGISMYDINRTLVVVEGMIESKKYHPQIMTTVDELLKFMKSMIIVYRNQLNPWKEIAEAILMCWDWIRPLVDGALQYVLDHFNMDPEVIQEWLENLAEVQGYLQLFFGCMLGILGIILKFNIAVLLAAAVVSVALSVFFLVVAALLFSLTLLIKSYRYFRDTLNPPPPPDTPALLEISGTYVAIQQVEVTH